MCENCGCHREGGDGHHHHHGHGHKAEIARQAASLALLASGIALQAAGAAWFAGWVELVWFAAAYLPVALPVAKEAAEGFSRREFFNEFTLMLVASVGAFAIGEYPEAVAVMLFYSVGEMLQDMAVDRARRGIRALVDMRPDTAAVVRQGRIEAVSPGEVAVGEEIEVKTGERVPLDGELLTARAAFDTSALTGESLPRAVERGGAVLAGMIAAERVVRLRVTKPAADSALSRIMRLVEEASERKAPAELFIRRFARVYTPAVTLLAALIVAVPFAASLFAGFDYVFSDWLYRGLVFLVISCPCALVVSIPLGYFAGIGAASRKGILFKGGNYIDIVAKIKAIAFDKTGTLTQGVFQVADVATAAAGSRDDLLRLMAAAERGSNHPIAKAIAAAAPEAGRAERTEEIAGEGVRAAVGGATVLVGNRKLMEDNGVAVAADSGPLPGTVVYCAADGVLMGRVLLADREKPDAAEAIARLRAEGVESVAILSGDRQPIVDHFASLLGADCAYGDLMPADKVERFGRFKSGRRGVVAYVGDGINDAPVLSMSDVGFAMGGLGSDAAIETADVVVETDSPARIADAMRVGKATCRIVRQNIVFALGVKLAILLLGACGMANLWAAVFADVGVAMLAILNSLRVLYASK